MKHKSLLSILLVVLLVFSVGCQAKEEKAEVATSQEEKAEDPVATEEKQEEKVEEKKDGPFTITDSLGREVHFNSRPQRVVAIGPGALRLYLYVADVNKLVGVEDMERQEKEGRPYNLAYPELRELTIIWPGGPRNAPDPEKLLEVEPDVIFSMYTGEAESVEKLQEKTGIAVVALSYGKKEVFDPELYKSLELIGEVMGTERGKEVVAMMEGWREDLDKRTKDMAEEERPRVYMGGMGMRGAHGIESTTGDFSLFNVIHSRNVVDEAGINQYVSLDKEKILELDPEMIFIDGGGYGLVKEDYDKDPTFYQGLKAFKEGKVYLHMPYNFYYTNIGVAIADSYYFGKMMYPKAFEDVKIEEKFDEIMKGLLGKPLYKEMSDVYFGGYQKVDFN